MKTILEHTISSIIPVLESHGSIYLNQNGNITRCKGIFYNNTGTEIKMVTYTTAESIRLNPEDEVYYTD
jgi:hypothetical protein